jgi:hypothetical protein
MFENRAADKRLRLIEKSLKRGNGSQHNILGN